MSEDMGDPFDGLHDELRGHVIRPDDEGYDEARTVWNAMIDKYPEAIARCAGAADVIASVNFARDNDVPVTVKSGGHDMKGTGVCDDGLVIDVSPMNGIRIDPHGKTARVQPGATWKEFNQELLAFDLITSVLGSSEVGVSGTTLGGGHGILDRKFGLIIDNLRSADVVTADGELVHASEEENADLFWALRGGGGNFGVVTSLEFDLYDAHPEVVHGRFIYPFEDAAEVLRSYRDFMADAPDEIQGKALVVRFPEHPPIPEPLHGETCVMLSPLYAGYDVSEGQELLQSIGEIADPLMDMVVTMTTEDLEEDSVGFHEAGRRNYWRSRFLKSLPDEAIDTLLEHVTPLPSTATKVMLGPLGGAADRVDRSATAFPHRDAAFLFGLYPQWSDPDDDDEVIEWTDRLHEVMAEYSTGGEYVNNQTNTGKARARAAYGDNFDRLVEIKNEWDPDNLFRINQNVEPTS